MSKTIFKKRFFCLLLALSVATCTIPSITVSAVMYTQGGYCRVDKFAYVCDRNDRSVILGEVWAGEGVTVLEHLSDYMVYIEFNTPNGPQRGLVSASVLPAMGFCFNSSYGEINRTCTTYYSPNTQIRAGTVYSGESVAVLCVSNGWAYIEYNVTSANAYRKRAYIPSSYVDIGSDTYDKDFYQNAYKASEYTVTGSKTVYGGPNDVSYAQIGSIDERDNGFMKKYVNSKDHFRNMNGDIMYYISYRDPNGNIKYGYVLA